jgi:hypothetical protein
MALPMTEPIAADKPIELAIAGAAIGIATAATTATTFLNPPPPCSVYGSKFIGVSPVFVT